MKDDLIKILNFKLRQIRENIDNLNQINKQIEDKKLQLEFIQDAIENFKGEGHGFDIYKFSNIKRETFNKLLMNLSDDVLAKFGTNSCNYDGLIYLINGINNGISLTLTQEQTEAINLFIDNLLEKEKEYQDAISSLNEDKQKLDVKDLDALSDLENKYNLIIENIDDKKYITEIDEIVDAINYSELSNERAFDILCYLLKYNSEVYVSDCNNAKRDIEEKNIDLSKPFDLNDRMGDDEKQNHFELSSDEFNEEEKKDIKIDLEEGENNSSDNGEYKPILPSFAKDEYFEKENTDNELPFNDEIDDQQINIVLPNFDLDLPVADDSDEYDVVNIPLEEQKDDDYIELNNNDSTIELDIKKENSNQENINIDNTEIQINENSYEPVADEEVVVGNDLENNELGNERTESEKKEDELVSFFDECDIDISDEINRTLLLKGSVDNYKNIIDKLKELNVYKNLKDDANLLIQILLYSNISIINEINEIIKNDLSLDASDKEITTDIVFKTIPSIFINSEKGNYNNFINNVKFFKEHGIDLINLFDFSREVFVTDNSFIVNNYEIVRNYELTVNAYNAKYLLLLKDVGSKIDFYVEAIYKDNSENGKGEIFDGIEMVKLYPNKLNTVNSETIKRLRFSSENGLKIFGTKEKALTGEITNLDVNIINMSEFFLSSLFNNQFDIIDRKEVDEYVDLVKGNKFVEMKEDSLLEKLSGYKTDLRYYIGDINVSSNKVIRNYNILVNNGVDNKKALLFAICYNLVITKSEYERLKLFINGLGGN